MDSPLNQGVRSLIKSQPETTPAAAAVLGQTSKVLQPITRLLLAHGVTYPQLADLLKSVFLDAAQHMAQDGGRLTDSELAVRTGLHRKDVKRLRNQPTSDDGGPAEDVPRSIPSTIVTRWLTEKAFCDKSGQPKPLPRTGEAKVSFEALVKSISKDVHPRTVLNELSRLKLIELDGENVHLKVDAFVPDSDFAHMVDYMGANLHDHAAAVERNISGQGPKFLEQSIYSDAIISDAVEDVAQLARREWGRVLKTVVPEVARYEPEPQNGKAGSPSIRTARIRLGMYFYAEPY